MPTIDLTPHLARESKPGPKDTNLNDASLPTDWHLVEAVAKVANITARAMQCPRQ